MKKKGLYSVLLGGIVCTLLSVNAYAMDYSSMSEEDYARVMEMVKDELRNGNLENEEDIRQAIDNAKQQYNVEIPDKEADKIVKVMDTVDSLGIDQDKIADVIDDVYDKVIDGKTYESTDELLNAIEDQIVDSAVDTVAQGVKEKFKISIKDYFSDFFNTIKDFFKRILAKWNA